MTEPSHDHSSPVDLPAAPDQAPTDVLLQAHLPMRPTFRPEEAEERRPAWWDMAKGLGLIALALGLCALLATLLFAR